MKKGAMFLAAMLAASAVGFFGCQEEQEEWQVYMPDGAPALALALPMYEDKENDGWEYHVVSATNIHTYVTGNAPEAELCVMPVNLAAKLLGTGSAYRLAGVVTHGNFYFLSKENVQYTRENAAGLIGKTVGVVQLNNVPGLTLKAALAALEIPYNDLTGGGAVSDNAVNLKAVSPSGLVGADVYMAPSPEADANSKNNGLQFVGSLQQLYSGDETKGYPQAVIVVKDELLKKDEARVRELLGRIDAGAAWIKTAGASTVVSAVRAHLADGLTAKFNEQNLTAEAIIRSGIWMQYIGAETVAEVSGFLQKLVAVDASMAAVPAEGFYWKNAD